MSLQHKDLAAGRWQEMSFVEQMANVGGEVERFLNWREKGRPEQSARAFERALELLGLTLNANRQRGRLREVARVREMLVDFYDGTNAYSSTAESWRRYFQFFLFAARGNR